MATEQERNRGLGAFSTPGVDAPADKSLAKIITTGPVVTFSLQNIGPPSNLYIARDDRIFLQGLTLLAGGDTVFFLARILRPDGQIIAHAWSVVIPAGSNSNNIIVTPDEGYLLALTATCQFALQRGATFARAAIFRVQGGANPVGQVLFADYVTGASGSTIGFPGGRVLYPTEGPGNLRSVAVANPAAGADWILTVPGPRRWRIVCFASVYTASATVATRNPEIEVDDGTNGYWLASVPTGITAGQSETIVGTGTNSPTGVVAQIESLVIPPNLWLPSGHRIRSITQNIQVGDQWSGILFFVEEWIDQA